MTAPHPARSPKGEKANARSTLSPPLGRGEDEGPASRGYTLIEVVVVLLVLALAAGLVAPSVGRSVDALRARAEVAGIASFLRAAREQAITREAACEVSVDPNAHSLVLREGETVRATKHLSPALHITPASPQARAITFYPQGLSSGGHFRIDAPGPSVYAVTVDALTGRVATRRRES